MPTPYTKLMLRDPEAPVVQAEFTSTIAGVKKQVNGALLDSGSSTTLIPEDLRQKLGLRLTGKDRIVDILGRETDRLLYEVKIALANYPNLQPLIIQVVEGGFRAKGAEYAIIGRDILNNFKLVLDGPNRQFEIVT